MGKSDTSSRRRSAGGAGSQRSLRHVALILECAVAPRRMMITGVARYIQEHEPWSVYLKPIGVEKSLPKWLREWHGDGVIAAVKDPVSDVVVPSGMPLVDVAGMLRPQNVPLVHTNDWSVGRLGAEHLLERGFRNLGFCQYAGGPSGLTICPNRLA
jgi:LacI family transcriptional regulator